MIIKKSHLKTLIPGFLVFTIPLIFLYYHTTREIDLALDRIEENQQEKKLNTANKITKKLNPFIYLKQEFNKIHADLFPEIPNNLITKVTYDSELKDLYNKELLDKLVELTKDKYDPIAITVGTKDLKDLYAYYCPKLEKYLKENKDEKTFLEAKSFFEISKVRDRHNNYFNTELKKDKIKILSELEEYLNQHNLSFHYYTPICYKYISRFNGYNRNESPIFTDYYEKQALYPIIKETISRNTIHGFYSLLIPQKSIDPEQILEFAISNNEPDINIKLVDNLDKSENIKDSNSINYEINFPTVFINQIDIFKRLRNIDKSYLLSKHITISINYPDEYNYLKSLTLGLKILTIFSILLFIILRIIFANNYQLFKIKLTKKLVFILSLVIFLPITGIGLLTLTITHNLKDLIDINVSKNLHNSLENYSLLNEEISVRRLSSIFEIKRIIANNNFSNFPNTFFEKIIENPDNKFWFLNFTNDLSVTSDNGEFYNLDILRNPMGKTENSSNKNKSLKKDELKNKLMEYIIKTYLSNLGLLKNRNKDNTEIFVLSLIEKYNNSKIEINSASQESVPHKNPYGIKNYDSSIYFYAKDKINNNYYFISEMNGLSNRRFNILKRYSETNPFWSKPNYKYAYDSNIAITIAQNISSKDFNRIQIPYTSINDNINDLIYKVIYIHDSGNEKIKTGNETTLNEWVISDKNPFVIAGTAKSLVNTKLSFITSLIFPLLLTYATFLLILLSKLISHFINKPISIFNEGIKKLNENNLGLILESFSKDEFNYITNAFNEMSIALKQKEQIKRFVSDRLVQYVENNPIQESVNGTQEKVTVLSSDIRNFTGISEKYEPSVIVEMLNSYFTKMQQQITANGGIIDKYIEDAIQAVFYDESNREDKVIRAAKAALAMRKALSELNLERQNKGLFTIENGIGIDTDFAISGTIGTSKGRKDFSVNGEVINRAANLEAKTKQTESKILISKASLQEIAESKDSLKYKTFDEESVELIDVR